jgi:hypothetical protein
MDPRERTAIPAEAEHDLTIALGIVNAQSLKQVRLSLDEITLPEAGESYGVAGNPPLHRPCSAFSLALQRLGHLPRQPQLGAQQVANPQTMVNGEALCRVIEGRGKFPGADEGRIRFLGPESAGQHQRLAEAGLQFESSVGRNRCGRGGRLTPGGFVCHRDRLAEMGDRFLKSGAAQSLVARSSPPFDREIVEAGFGEVMGDDFRLGRGVLGLADQDFRGARCSACRRLLSRLS